MLKGDDIKQLIKSTENWRVEFKLAKGDVLYAGIVQVELAHDKPVVINAVKSAIQPEDAEKRLTLRARLELIEKCAELYQWSEEDPQRTVQQTVSSSVYSAFDYLQVPKDAFTLECHGPANGREWDFMFFGDVICQVPIFKLVQSFVDRLHERKDRIVVGVGKTAMLTRL